MVLESVPALELEQAVEQVLVRVLEQQTLLLLVLGLM